MKVTSWTFKHLRTLECLENPYKYVPAGMNMLGSSIPTCAEFVLADFSLETIRYRRHFIDLCDIVKWNTGMIDERVPFKSLSNKWDKVKSIIWLPQKMLAFPCLPVNSLKKGLNDKDKVLEIKIIKQALDKRECVEFEIALQHKSKLLHPYIVHTLLSDQYRYC